MARLTTRRLALMSALAVLATAAAVTGFAGTGRGGAAPFRAFESLGADERAALDAGRPIVTLLPARERELAVFGAIPVSVGSDRHVAWFRAIEQFQRGRYVTAIRRFSDPPRLEDLAALTLPPEDLDALRACRPGDCDVKLAEAEIIRIRQAIATAGAGWKDAAQETFRRVMLARAVAYLSHGHRDTAPYRDGATPVSLPDEFARLASHVELGAPYGPMALDYLKNYPVDDRNEVESFLFWAQEKLGGVKPVITITHAAIFHGLGTGASGTLVASKQVFATHYFSGSLSLTLIDGRDGGTRYLLYERRARLDMLEGIFGGLVRRVVQRRLKNEAPAVLEDLKRRLESGPP